MNIGGELNQVDYDELLDLYNVVSDFISYLDNEIETSEVEKK